MHANALDRSCDTQEVGLCLCDCMPGVVRGVVLVSGAVVGDAADDCFGVVAPRQGTLCVGCGWRIVISGNHRACNIVTS
jgi:hypothetical protein